MTNSGIRTSAILDALYKEKADEWRQAEDEFVRLSFREFSKILRKHQIAVDPRTFRLKWELLTDMEVFRATTKTSTVVSLVDFEAQNLAKYDLTSSWDASTHTLTHTPEEASE